MSSAYFIVLSIAKPKFDATVNGKFLAQDAKKLAKIADKLSIAQLDDFLNYSPEEARGMMEDMGLDPEEIEATDVPAEKWFTPQEGLDVVAQLSAHVTANPKLVKNAQGVLSDLAEFTEVLSKAKKAKVKFKLQMDY